MFKIQMYVFHMYFTRMYFIVEHFIDQIFNKRYIMYLFLEILRHLLQRIF